MHVCTGESDELCSTSNAFDLLNPGRHTQTHTCTVMQTHTGKERRSQRKLLLFIMPFYSMHTVLLPPLQMSVFHYVLDLSAGHRYDNSKSVLLPKCQEGEMTINRGSMKVNIKHMLKIR